MFLDTVLVKVVSNCNLNCSYCYVYNSEDTSYKEQPNNMTFETIELVSNSLIQQSKQQDIGFAIVIHGGEPLLLGIEKMKLLLSKLRNELTKNKFPIAIQTNGILINDEYIKLFLKYDATISVSIDGNQSINDLSRLDHKNNSSYLKVINGIENLQDTKTGIFSGTLSVIHPQTNPQEVYSFFKSLNVSSANFLMHDGNYDKLPYGKSSFESLEYGKWIKQLIKIYLSDENPIEIPFIDELIKTILGGNSVKEGIGEESYGIIIIETDGEIRKNDTLRSSYNGADFFEKRPNISNTTLNEIVKSSEFKEVMYLQSTLPEECKRCNIVNICGGGMPLYRWSKVSLYNNPSVYCNDHKLYINYLKEILSDED